MKDYAIETRPPYSYPANRPATYRNFGKRMFDILLGTLTAPVLAPAILILWTIIRRDGGPGFYAQDRIGRHGRVFRCWKLRTMVVDAERALEAIRRSDPKAAAEWDENQKLRNDPRITRIGGFLRATSLDELPQLWNVLRGDMSFVGPRPFMPSQKELYDRAGGKSYYGLRPGITGRWQVLGRNATNFVARVDYDEAYERSLSAFRDIELLVKTLGVVVRRTGS